MAKIIEIAKRHNPVELRESQSAEESAKIWLGRKSAFGAMGQMNDYMCLDGTIPVSSLPEVLRRIGELSEPSTACPWAMCSMRATAICIR